MSTALIIVDVQNDFIPGGSLAVPKGDEIISVINDLRKNQKWGSIFLTQDFHPQNHISFSSNHPGTQPFQQIKLDSGIDQVMWPDHCVQGTDGCKFHRELKLQDTDIIVQKGTNPKYDSYSGFFDNAKLNTTELHKKLQEKNVSTVYCCGLASDYCVSYTALDAVSLGYKTYFIRDATRGIDKQNEENALSKMKAAGITVLNSTQIDLSKSENKAPKSNSKNLPTDSLGLGYSFLTVTFSLLLITLLYTIFFSSK